MTKPVLIVEDDPLQRQMLVTLLDRKLGFESHQAEHGREALAILETDTAQAIKLVILDLEMPVMNGMETLEILHQQYPHVAVIMLTGNRDMQVAIDAMKSGASDFLTKPYEGERMAVTVKNALRMSALSHEVTRLKSEKEGRFTFSNLIGHDGGLAPIVAAARKAAGSDIPVLITGETGTGKEVFARAIHGEGTRAGKPFIAVNCGAIPEQLVESTLFGHEKGAFTGATDKVIGKFREAEGGTIFLDEVGELPRDTQVKLLRVLQQKEVEPVGAGKPIRVNVRVISATNRNLQDEIIAGNFREDLFFRLNVLQLELPPLRNRANDIPALVTHFIERFCAAEGAMPKALSDSLLQNLQTHNWPGNVRQLENSINRAMVMSEGNVLEAKDFSDLTHNQKDVHVRAYNDTLQTRAPTGTLKTMAEIEQDMIRLALAHHDHNITQAAKSLGIAKSTFYKKMKK